MSLFLHSLFSNPWTASIFLLPLLAILGDVLTGSLMAMKHRAFDLRMLADFAKTQSVGYVAILLPALLAAFATHQDLHGVFVMVQTPLLPWYASQIASIDDNIAGLTGADAGVINGVVTSLIDRVFGHQPIEGNDEEGTPPAAPVAASSASL